MKTRDVYHYVQTLSIIEEPSYKLPNLQESEYIGLKYLTLADRSQDFFLFCIEETN